MTDKISREDREKITNQVGTVIWLTGYSGSGKSTLAIALEKTLHNMGCLTYILDGDVLRGGLNVDLGLSPEDRDENIRRTSSVAALFADAGVICICALISPYEVGRKDARERASDRFLEVFVDCPISICRDRDPKGLYKKFDDGEISGLTGLDAPYECPRNPDLVVKTGEKDVDACVKDIMDLIHLNNVIDLYGY